MPSEEPTIKQEDKCCDTESLTGPIIVDLNNEENSEAEAVVNIAEESKDESIETPNEAQPIREESEQAPEVTQELSDYESSEEAEEPIATTRPIYSTP